MELYEEVISAFGGYNAAKKISESDNIGMILNVVALRERLLEYRRAHNIFEIGDKVIYNFTSLIGEFSSYSKQSYRHCFVNFEEDNGLILIKNIRHATPEEMAAGHRIDHSEQHLEKVEQSGNSEELGNLQ